MSNISRVNTKKIHKFFVWYLFLLIPLTGTIFFNIYPLIKTVYQSFSNTEMTFIGVTNYSIMFGDNEFKQAFINTLYMGILGVIMNIPTAFIMAYILNNITVGKNISRTIFMIPMIISIVALAQIFKLVFKADPNSIANSFIALIGLEPLGWFSDTRFARELSVFMAVWKGVGYNIILFYAGLQSIPVTHYEAAKIEGANEWQKIKHIVIPGVKNIFIVVNITTWIAVFKRFTDVFVIGTEYGNPANRLLTLIMYLYRKSFSQIYYKDIGIAATTSCIIFVLILVITAINYLVTEDKDTIRGGRND